jgi:hypothetical protein
MIYTNLFPYLSFSLHLAAKPRRGGGNMFRHQMETLAILPEYKYKFAQISENVSISGAIITIQIFLQTEFISSICSSQQKYIYL